MTRARILIVEDDPAIRRGLADAMAFDGFETIACGCGLEGLERARSGAFDLVLLDVMLPGLSGFEVLAGLRRSKPTLPVILVTAKGAEQDRVRGLRDGADDYVVKPFSAKELLARVGAVLRRSAERPLDIEQVDVAGRHVDLARREVTLADGTVNALSDREAGILRYLAANRGRAVAREELLQSVWGLNPRGIRPTRTVDMHVARLREKIADDPTAPQVIATVRGKGYMLAGEIG